MMASSKQNPCALRDMSLNHTEGKVLSLQLGEGVSPSSVVWRFNFVTFQHILTFCQSIFSTVTQTCMPSKFWIFSWFSFGIMMCRSLPCGVIFAMNFNGLPIFNTCLDLPNMKCKSQLYLAICLYLAILFILSYKIEPQFRHNKGGG